MAPRVATYHRRAGVHASPRIIHRRLINRTKRIYIYGSNFSECSMRDNKRTTLRPLDEHAARASEQSRTPIAARCFPNKVRAKGFVFRSLLFSPVSTLSTLPPDASRESWAKPRHMRWYFRKYLNLREYPFTKADRALSESVYTVIDVAWPKTSSQTARIGRVACIQSAAAMTSASAVDLAVATCRREAQSSNG